MWRSPGTSSHKHSYVSRFSWPQIAACVALRGMREPEMIFFRQPTGLSSPNIHRGAARSPSADDPRVDRAAGPCYPGSGSFTLRMRKRQPRRTRQASDTATEVAVETDVKVFTKAFVIGTFVMLVRCLQPPFLGNFRHCEVCERGERCQRVTLTVTDDASAIHGKPSRLRPDRSMSSVATSR